MMVMWEVGQERRYCGPNNRGRQSAVTIPARRIRKSRRDVSDSPEYGDNVVAEERRLEIRRIRLGEPRGKLNGAGNNADASPTAQ